MALTGSKRQSDSNKPLPDRSAKKNESSKQEVLRSPQPNQQSKILTAEGWKRRMMKRNSKA